MALQDVAVNAECREDQYRAGRIPVVAVSVIGEGMGVYDLASVYDVGMRKQRYAAHVCGKEHGKQQLDGDMSSYEFPHGIVSARKNREKSGIKKAAVPDSGRLPLSCCRPYGA